MKKSYYISAPAMIDFIRAYGYSDREIALACGVARESITRIRAGKPGYIGVGIEETLTRFIHNLTALDAPQVSYAPLSAVQPPVTTPQRQPAPVPIVKEHAPQRQPVTIAAPIHKPGGRYIDGAYCSSCHRLISGRAYAVPGQPIGRYTQYLCEEHGP